MTHKEFTFWLKGFLDGIGGVPNDKDTQLILVKLSEVRDENYITTTPGLTTINPIYRGPGL
jgi:hypothetical protein